MYISEYKIGEYIFIFCIINFNMVVFFQWANITFVGIKK